jgi:hypothetical protein
VIFAGIKETAAKSLPGVGAVRAIPDGVRAVVERPEDLGGALQAALKGGAQIVSVNPIRPSLEEFFERS